MHSPHQSHRLTLLILLVLLHLFPRHLAAAAASSEEEYRERLLLRPLPKAAVLASFNFRTNASASSFASQNFRHFPRSLGQILQHARARELHLRFGAGRWDDAAWGARPWNGAREGGTGVEIWAWVEAAGDALADARWRTLTNALSGLFCASLNFVDATRTVRPALTFLPQGDFPGVPGANLHLLHGTLPGEVVCTENLTPFLKLLPCKGKAGVSSLLDGHRLFDSTWQSMAIDFRTVCPKGKGKGKAKAKSADECVVQVDQTIDMVIDIERSKLPRDDPIPRPPVMKEVVCNSSKPYDIYEDSCFPLEGPSAPAFRISGIFGRPLKGACPFSDQSEKGMEPVCLDIPSERKFEVRQGGAASKYSGKINKAGGLTCLSVPTEEDINIVMEDQEVFSPSFLAPSTLRAERTLTGYGQHFGGIRIVITNPSAVNDVELSYMESVPWFMKPYMHTLRSKVAPLPGSAAGSATPTSTEKTIKQMFYRPAIDRSRGSHLELLVSVPAASTVTLTYDFEKSILRYAEYPPDANRGFNVPSAIIRVLSPRSSPYPTYLRTTALLLYLPTPDFSMPYNVIILSSTVIALAFGSVFNILVRRFVAKDEGPAGGKLATLARAQLQSLRTRLEALRGRKSKEE